MNNLLARAAFVTALLTASTAFAAERTVTLAV
jgi:hypothetical protein